MSNKAFVSLCSACGQGFAEDNTEVGRPRLTKCRGKVTFESTKKRTANFLLFEARETRNLI